jgi:hypothetical protein
VGWWGVGAGRYWLVLAIRGLIPALPGGPLCFEVVIRWGLGACRL